MFNGRKMMISIGVALMALVNNVNNVYGAQASIQDLLSISSEPTESPAPSPSPSAVPTVTQAPSFSLSPSITPTLIPTLEPSETPSNPPTLFPTESPAPSPSPSDTPTGSPSQSPSLSLHPSASLQPSASPTAHPSGAPSISFAPTGPVLLVAKAVKVIFPDVVGTMDKRNIELFEEETKLYLQRKVHHAVGVWEMEVQSITVTGQSVVGSRRALDMKNNANLLRRAEQHEPKSLLITFQAVAAAILDRSENFDLTLFLEIFFENADNVLELRTALQQVDSYAQAVFIQEPESDDNVGAAKGPTITGVIFGVSMSMVGSALIWMWMKKRRSKRNGLGEEPNSELKDPTTFSKSYDSQYDDPSTSPLAFVVESKTFETFHNPYNGPFTFRNDDEDERPQSPPSIETSIVLRGGQGHLMYEPALIRTESNIEVPETPVTAFTMNKNTFTPQGETGYEDGDTAIETCIGVQRVPPTEDENSVGSVIGSYSTTSRRIVGSAVKGRNEASHQKRARFPIVFKSPFRRVKAENSDGDNNHDDHECNEVSSESGGIMAAGRALINHKNTIIVSNTIRNENDENAAPPRNTPSIAIPIAIGGPDFLPSLVQSTVSRGDSVGIVDEVAYLYSTVSMGDSIIRLPSNLSKLSHSVEADYAAQSGAGEDGKEDVAKNYEPTTLSTLRTPTRSVVSTTVDESKSRANGYFSDDGDNIEEIEVYED